MLQAYVDDSGNTSSNSNPAFFLAGYLAPSATWTVISDEWFRLLSELPKIAYLKASEAESLKCQFCKENWSTTKRDTKIGKFTSLLQEHRSEIHGLVVSLQWDDFINEQSKLLDAGWVEARLIVPYEILFHGILNMTTNYMMKTLKKRERIEFIFDNQNEIGDIALKSYRIVKKMLPQEQTDLIVDPTFRDEQEVLPLQAADLLAWSTRRLLAERLGKTQINSSLMANTLEQLKGITHVIQPNNPEILHDKMLGFCRLQREGSLPA